MEKKKLSVNAKLFKGRVIKSTGSFYTVRMEDGKEVSCRIKGNFRIKGIRTTNPVAVGDIVEIEETAGDEFYIRSITPRKNYIIRRASNLSKESHILAANIDLALLVATIKDPLTPTTCIDRFLATAEAYSIKAAIVLNKEDTWDEEDREYGTVLKTLYEQIGYPVFIVSAVTKEGLPMLMDELKGKITLLAGNSGVGKSSIINAIVPDANLRIGDISDIHHTGTHTTTFSEMIDIPEGGALIDVPGVRGFGTIDFSPEEVSHFFPDIFEVSRNCKYGNCKHVNEPGCAVVPAVRDHFISESRYTSYMSILDEVSAEAGSDKYRKPF